MSDMRTQVFIPKPVRGATLLIIDNRKQPTMVSLQGSATMGKNYPESDRKIRLYSSIVSRRHGEFVYDQSEDAYYYLDNNSLNGTYVNGRKLESYNQRGSKAVRLSDGDILRIDRQNLDNPHEESVVIIFSRSFDPNEQWTVLNTSQLPAVTIGRGEQCNARLSDPMASNFHALIQYHMQGATLIDQNSTNGMLVNNRLVQGSVPLYRNDVIRIANTIMIFLGNSVVYNNPGERSGCLSVRIHDKTVRHGFSSKTLIKDINFEADMNDFILILGGSGAGKTTLINSVLGDGSVNGKVLLNGTDLYENFKTMKSQIGLVPQFVNLRENDKVISTLMDIADIKLRGYTKQEKFDRIQKILKKLGVSNLQNHLIRQLSGGQKKKISVAAQLVGFQKVFICDEPDSGLDPASRMQQMEILGDIANSGKIVMVISHEPENAMDENGQYRFTKILVLAKDSRENCGKLAYYGDTYEALRFFGVKTLEEIIVQINPAHEGGMGRGDYFIDKFAGRTM